MKEMRESCKIIRQCLIRCLLDPSGPRRSSFATHEEERVRDSAPLIQLLQVFRGPQVRGGRLSCVEAPQADVAFT